MKPQDIGRILQEKRAERGVDLDAAAKATRIKRHYLEALEAGDFGQLPSQAQVRGFLRAYAGFLEMDAESLFAQLRTHDTSAEVSTQAQAQAEPANISALSDADKQAALAFAVIGGELRKRREQMELSLLEVAEHTHLPEHYLARLERGEFDNFPSPVQGRGMLSNYAEFLGLESEALLASYGEALQQRFDARAAQKPAKRISKPSFSFSSLKFRMPEWLRPFLSRDLAFGTVVGALLLLFVIFSIGRIIATRAAAAAQPTAPPIVGLLLSSPSPQSQASVVAQNTEGAINLLEQPTTNPGLLGEATIQSGTGNIALRLLATQRTWMRVTVDGQVQFEGRTLPGQTYNFSANGQILLLTGNAAALRVFFNEQDLGILGLYGEVIQVLFNAQGASTPTVSPTPTIDPAILTGTANAALTPSSTPSPSSTATPTPTIDSGTPTP